MELKKYPYVIKGIPQVFPNVTKNTPLFSNAVVAGNLVFISGQTAIDPETGVCVANTIQDQMQIVMEKIDRTLQECGTSLDYLIKDLIILKDMKDYPVMRAVQQEYYRQHAPRLLEAPPGSTVFQAAELVRPYYLVEIEAVALIPDKA
ncbi:MAG: RidA family protein [Oscillospiraceae bacterium]